ncbi:MULTISPECIES: hypothetical protein [unclassified Mesorhizobium]|nr:MULTISPECIES: hypothetical protein [unclassified Mesorhizobium]
MLPTFSAPQKAKTAAFAWFLLSDAAADVTGRQYVVDGELTML